jgi:8-oxo-dGTP pyrophosphatase MutT (NUDIX family)
MDTPHQQFFNERNVIIIEEIRNRLRMPLPGIEAQIRLAPLYRLDELRQKPPEEAIPSGVLLLLYPNNSQLHSVAILRAEYNGVHSGQVSLPGGKREPSDRDIIETALRESFEETGIDPESVDVLGRLTPLYINRSNYIIFPVVGYTGRRPEFRPDVTEVQEIIEFRIADLLGPEKVIHRSLSFPKGFTFRVPGFELGPHFMWGATAMIVSEFLDVMNSL